MIVVLVEREVGNAGINSSRQEKPCNEYTRELVDIGVVSLTLHQFSGCYDADLEKEILKQILVQ